jgi:hypothetical protein
LVNGRQDQRRQRDHDEQGPRTDRGAPSVWLAREQIDIVVHPQSVIHSLVEYADGSMLAQLGSPDMRVPIGHVLAWPERMGRARGGSTCWKWPGWTSRRPTRPLSRRFGSPAKRCGRARRRR